MDAASLSFVEEGFSFAPLVAHHISDDLAVLPVAEKMPQLVGQYAFTGDLRQDQQVFPRVATGPPMDSSAVARGVIDISERCDDEAVDDISSHLAAEGVPISSRLEPSVTTVEGALLHESKPDAVLTEYPIRVLHTILQPGLVHDACPIDLGDGEGDREKPYCCALRSRVLVFSPRLDAPGVELNGTNQDAKAQARRVMSHDPSSHFSGNLNLVFLPPIDFRAFWISESCLSTLSRGRESSCMETALAFCLRNSAMES